jgi:hypothetical protein
LRSLLLPHDSRLVINDVGPVGGRVMSHRPLALRVHSSASALQPPRFASVRVEGDDGPFVVERLIDPGDLKAGYTDIDFTDEQTLPSGAALFRVSLFNEAGHGAQFLVTCAVLPSNPLDLGLDSGLVGHLGNVG